MKNILKKIIVYFLSIESRLVLWKYKPKIIAVTGSVGKTSTKDAIYTVLRNFYFVRRNEKSFNSEIGTPLTILGCENGWNNPLIWLKNLLKGLILIVLPHNYPKWLILEIGADRPGDIKKITKWLKPDIAVITKFSNVPVHVEFFKSPDDLVEEKSYVVRNLKRGGVLIVNSDDEKSLSFENITKEKVLHYGFKQGSNVCASNNSVLYENTDSIDVPVGITFKIETNGKNLPVTLNGVLGIQHIYPVLAAVAIASSQGLNIVKSIEAASEHNPPRGRMNIIKGINNSVIIDDSYNSSPIALDEALKTLHDLNCSGRKIAVLGDMLELGKYSFDEHKRAGMFAGSFLDLLITVGIRAEGFGEGAIQSGMNKSKVLNFKISKEAGDYLRKNIGVGDIILAKGSQSIRVEKVVKSIMNNPENSKTTLVRQEKEWARR